MINNILRAKVINSKDPEKLGRVLVWIPDLMPLVPDNIGIWARAANNPIGGRNTESFDDQNFSGSCLIPPKGSWVLIFFEKGNPNFPYYITSLNLENTKVLPECQLGKSYDHKWVLYKSNSGRCVVISDDADDCRVEITGKKRKLKNPPSGDTDSVYTIDENQTTILLDERNGKEKVLIRTHKGDFIHVDVDERQLHIDFDSDIHIKSGGNLYISAENIHMKSTSNINLRSIDDTNIKSNNINIDAVLKINMKSGSQISSQSSGSISHKAISTLANDGITILDNVGASLPASSAKSADDANPIGNRDT